MITVVNNVVALGHGYTDDFFRCLRSGFQWKYYIKVNWSNKKKKIYIYIIIRKYTYIIYII